MKKNPSGVCHASWDCKTFLVKTSQHDQVSQGGENHSQKHEETAGELRARIIGILLEGVTYGLWTRQFDSLAELDIVLFLVQLYCELTILCSQQVLFSLSITVYREHSIDNKRTHESLL